MTIVYCEKCGGYTPEGFTLCPPCMSKAGAPESEIKAVTELLEVVNIINMGDTDASQKAAIESILSIKKRLEGTAVEQEEKEPHPAQENRTAHASPGQHD